jgi:hypothetical protein
MFSTIYCNKRRVTSEGYFDAVREMQRNEATVHLTEIIKNVKSEVHLCEACARGIGLNSKLSNFSLTVPDMCLPRRRGGARYHRRQCLQDLRRLLPGL